MRPLKLAASALIANAPLSDSRVSASEEREDGEESVHTPKTPSDYASQESRKTESELSEIEYLELALEYLEKRFNNARQRREERYEMCSQSPKGSEDSVLVTYSQDSQLSGRKPPKDEVVAEIILNTLPEDRLQQLFTFGNVDDINFRVGKALNFLKHDFDFFGELVKEAIGILGATRD